MKLAFSISALATAMMAATAGIALAQDAPVLVDRTVAEVGGRRISLSDVMGEVRERVFEERLDPSEKLMASYFAEALSNQVARQLILREYDDSSVKIPEWYFNQRIERIIENGFGGDKSRLVAALAEHGISYPDWRRHRNEDTIMMTMRQQFVSRNVKVRPIDMERVYRERYATNSLPGHVKVSMIMLRDGADDAEGTALEKARSLLKELETGATFDALARRHSLESHAENGGSWGYIEPAAELRAELANALAAIKPGQVAGPVEVAGYVYLLRKDDERSDLSVPFSIVMDEIEAELREVAAEERYQAWIRHLATKYTVRIFDMQ